MSSVAIVLVLTMYRSPNCVAKRLLSVDFMSVSPFFFNNILFPSLLVEMPTTCESAWKYVENSLLDETKSYPNSTRSLSPLLSFLPSPLFHTPPCLSVPRAVCTGRGSILLLQHIIAGLDGA